MIIKNKIFPAKLLLFGEYTILHCGKGLAIPLDEHCGTLTMIEESDNNSKASNDSLIKMIPSFKKGLLEGFDVLKFEKDCKNGLYFDSNIPQGYGIGSSAALSSALYDCYVTNKKTELVDIKNELAKIESFFHGSSSGIDPLVSYTGYSILLKKDTIEKVDESCLKSNFFLIDTNQKRETKSLVGSYQEKFENDLQFRTQMEELAMLNDRAIQLYLNEDPELFFVIKKISKLQYEALDYLIPEHFNAKWKESLDADDYAIKLNGAGGGGFMQGYQKNV